MKFTEWLFDEDREKRLLAFNDIMFPNGALALVFLWGALFITIIGKLNSQIGKYSALVAIVCCIFALVWIARIIVKVVSKIKNNSDQPPHRR